MDKVSGPMPREELAELAKAPFGEALRAIRKYDPLYGIKPGEKIKFQAKFERQPTEEGYAIIEAESLEQANEIADKLPESKISWDVTDYGDAELISVEPKAEKP